MAASSGGGGAATPRDIFFRALVTKHSTWRGSYRRIFALSPSLIVNVDPATMAPTNQWPLSLLLAADPDETREGHFTVGIAASADARGQVGHPDPAPPPASTAPCPFPMAASMLSPGLYSVVCTCTHGMVVCGIDAGGGKP